MNRRTFLKSIATVCGAAVVCPGELVKGPVEFRPNATQRVYMIELPWKAYHNGGHFKTEAEYKEFLEKFRIALKNTKFKHPVYGLPRCYLKGVPIYYQENLST